MTALAWFAWLTIFTAPWAACAAALASERWGATAVRASGGVWCAGGLLLLAILELPVTMTTGADSPTLLPVLALASLRWTVTAPALWGVVASGLAVWWTTTDDEPRAVRCLTVLVCGVTAQAWFVDHAGLLLALQSLLTELCALLVGSSVGSGLRGAAFRARWWAGAWADAVLWLAVLGAASALRTGSLTELAAADRLRELAGTSPGIISQVGLLFAIAVCGGWFQFPCSSVRDVAAVCSPLTNVCLWQVALLPFAVRWVIAARAWWSADEVLTNLAVQWSIVAALAMAWCALTGPSPWGRIAWWLGVQGALAVPVLMHHHSGIGVKLMVEHWCVAGCAAAWLFGATHGTGEDAQPRSRFATGLAWLAAALVAGLMAWPAALTLAPQFGWLFATQLCVLVLSGAGAVQLAAETCGRLTDRALWSSLWLVWTPAAAACLGGQTGSLLLESVSMPVTQLGWLACGGGVLAAAFWRRDWPKQSDERRSLGASLAAVGRVRFCLPALFQLGIEWPVRGAAQAARFGEWLMIDATLLSTLRSLHRPGHERGELQSAGPEFYALALSLTAAALVITVMWLAQ